jgi:predicted methyltransferase
MTVKIFAAPVLAASLLMTASTHAQPAPNYAAIVAAPDRSDADHKTDVNRAPAQWLAYLDVKPGMKVLDIFGVVGWKAELIARAVSPGGTVYEQNSQRAFDHFKDAIAAREKAHPNLVSVVRPFEDPAPPGVHDFDLVEFFWSYHDTTYLGVDRPKMFKAIYAALKPGGYFVMGDYSAKPGSGTSVVQTLHRSDEALAKSEIEAAGFKLVGHGDFLRHPEDKRESHSHTSGSPVDCYVLKFQKPLS